MGVRVRYAPSPTGYQHIAGARVALFNYLFARSKGGTYILRIEDTDRERYRKDALEDIYAAFSWLGFYWDEGPDVGGKYGPYCQSERGLIYREYAQKLIDLNAAYRCYCTRERLEKLREDRTGESYAAGYDRHCRNLSESERRDFEAKGITPVIRLKIPLEGKTAFNDMLRGTIETANRDISPDPILLKSDGFPTYQLANVIDDHLMQISHIFRGQEWIPSVPVHIHIYNTFGWIPPRFFHLPLIMGKDGRKLGKRHGSTGINEFRQQGYLPEALINYIAMLGWSYDDSREFFTLKELESLFSIDKLNKAPAIFDHKKLLWLNGNYIRKKSEYELRTSVQPYLAQAGLVSDQPTIAENAILDGFIPLARERMRILAEAPDLARFLFREPELSDTAELIPKKADQSQVISILENIFDLLDNFIAKTDEQNETEFRALAAKLGIKLGDLMMPLRVALTGSRISLPLFESMRLLGIEKVKQRIKRAVFLLSENAGQSSLL